MHDIRWCPHCRENLSDLVFERVPHEWRRYRERHDNRVNADDPLFHVITGMIPSALQCTVPNDTRAKFKVEGSLGQGNMNASPRYSFPTLGSVQRGIFVCSQYHVLDDGGLGDYLVSIIVGRQGLDVPNKAAAMRELVGRSRDILGVESARTVRPQGSYRHEIVDQIEFSCRNPPTAEQFRAGLNDILTRVAVKETELKALWDEVRAHPDRYPADERIEEIHRRGRRGEEYILEMEREWLIASGYPEKAKEVRRYPARGPNHDIQTFRLRDGRLVDHYIEVKTTSRHKFNARLSRLQTEFALDHPQDTSIAIFTYESEDDPLGEPRMVTDLAERRRYFRPEIVERRRRMGMLPEELRDVGG